MAVAWPLVKAHLVQVLPTLVDAKVYDGPITTAAAPARWITVGWQPSTEDESAGSYEQSQLSDGWAADETGNVLLEVAATTGGTTVPDAFALVDALQDYVQGDPSLGGVLDGAPTVSLTVEVLQAQSNAGAVQRLLVGLNYTCSVA